MIDVDRYRTSILAGLKGQLGEQWSSFSERDRAIIEKVANRGAKLAEAEARGNTAYVEKHREAFESMVLDLEAAAAIEAATFWNALLDTGSTILISLAKKSLGLP